MSLDGLVGPSGALSSYVAIDRSHPRMVKCSGKCNLQRVKSRMAFLDLGTYTGLSFVLSCGSMRLKEFAYSWARQA